MMELGYPLKYVEKWYSCPKQCDDQTYNEGQSKTESNYCHESLNIVKLNNSEQNIKKVTHVKNQSKKRYCYKLPSLVIET